MLQSCTILVQINKFVTYQHVIIQTITFTDIYITSIADFSLYHYNVMPLSGQENSQGIQLLFIGRIYIHQ